MISMKKVITVKAVMTTLVMYVPSLDMAFHFRFFDYLRQSNRYLSSTILVRV